MFATSKSADAVYLAGGDGVADAMDFDGTNDYLSRASDLTGNTDGKTFTFSYFGWRNATGSLHTIYDNGKVTIQVNASDQVIITGKNAAGTTILSATATASTIQKQTFDNLLISIDLANTSNRSIYIDDVAATVTWAAYTNDTLDWTTATHAVGAVYSGFASKYAGRLSGLFLDYTYRNLSVEATRRLFFTADRKPAANQAALSPILYLPLSDQTQPGLNLGTGGNFALTGVVARSGRGPSQFNAHYSDLDGTADYLSRTTALTGMADGKVFTMAFCFNADSLNQIYSIGESGVPYPLVVSVGGGGSGKALLIQVYDTAKSALAINATVTDPLFTIGRNYIVVLSIDVTNPTNRQITVNGATASVTWATYTNTNLHLTYGGSGGGYYVGLQAGFFNGRLGNVFFDTKYIDLSQPANLAKFVTSTGIDAKPVDLGANGEKPFGTPPLIYLPMYGNNAGKNYGSGGDFTVNSGPYLGAKGPNEFYFNKWDFNGSTSYANRLSQLIGVVDTKQISGSFVINKNASTTYTIFDTDGASFRISINASNQLVILAKNSAGTTILNATTTSTISNTQNTNVLFCFDLSNTSNRYIYFNGIASTVTWTTYVNDFIDVTVNNYSIGAETGLGNKLAGKLAEFCLTSNYIDFSQESNRLKFFDAFANPVNLTYNIGNGSLTSPVIYMRFDPSNSGKNYGTGGDFNVTGYFDGGQI